MKHSKNMVIKPSPEATELTLYAINDGYLYEHSAMPIIINLQKKAKKGTYNKAMAIDAFYYLAQEAAKKYCKDFAHVEDAPQIFDVTSRYTAAAAMLEHYEEQILEALEEN